MAYIWSAGHQPTRYASENLEATTQPIADFTTEGSGSTMELVQDASKSNKDAVDNLTISSPSPSQPASGDDTYQFKACQIEKIAERTLVDALKDLKYDPTKCRLLSHELGAEIMEKIRDLAIQRFKLVVVVSIGSVKEKPGMQFGSRCLWNKETDNFVSVKYTNSSLFAVVLIYGLYYGSQRTD